VWNKKMSMKQSVHPQLNVYKRQQDLSIYLIFTNFVWMNFTDFWFCFQIEKNETQKGTLKMTLKVIPRKTLLAYNIDEERKDKYERKLHS
jgi:hypothetical protein